MERRTFLELLTKGYLGASIFGLTSCSKKQAESVSPKRVLNRTINLEGVTYQIQDGVLSQATKGDDQIKLGIMADLHAHQKNSQYFAEQLNQENVETYLLLGDLSHSFGDYEGAKDDVKEIISVTEPIADTGKLVLATNGNHEKRKLWEKAMNYLI